MPWLKTSDQAAFHPIVMEAGMHAAEMQLTLDRSAVTNLVYGFVGRCAVAAAAHQTDYVISAATAWQIAGDNNGAALIELATMAGYWTPTTTTDGRAAFLLTEDDELHHMIRKAERDWMKSRDRDRRNTTLTVPVRQRDGDACRWCGNVVYWGDQRGGRGGTYDHVHPGQPATVATYVVACRSCNSARQDALDTWTRSLRPAPSTPFYSTKTAAFLAEHGITVTPSDPSTTTPGAAPGSTATTVAPSNGHRAPSPAPGATASPAQDATASVPAPPPSPAPGATASPAQDATAPAQSPPNPRPIGDRPKKHKAPGQPGETPTATPSPAQSRPKPPNQKGGCRDGTGRVGPGQEGPGRTGTGRSRDPAPPAPAAPKTGPGNSDQATPKRSRRRKRPRDRRSTS